MRTSPVQIGCLPPTVRHRADTEPPPKTGGRKAVLILPTDVSSVGRRNRCREVGFRTDQTMNLISVKKKLYNKNGTVLRLQRVKHTPS
jgi:hypothetical protein